MGQLRKAAEEALGMDVDLQGAGRTDAGVHALGQVAHLRANTRERIPPSRLLRELNDRLSADIAVLDVEEKPNRFHARHDALSRSYVYQISTRKNAFSKRHVWWIKESLDVDLMREAALRLAGRHDFACFRAPDPSKPDESTIVAVASAGLEQHGDLLIFRIEASHFLWRMVRRITGVLVKLGKGDIRMEDFETLLEARCDARFKVPEWTAPSAGLFLERVRYRGEAD